MTEKLFIISAIYFAALSFYKLPSNSISWSLFFLEGLIFCYLSSLFSRLLFFWSARVLLSGLNTVVTLDCTLIWSFHITAALLNHLSFHINSLTGTSRMTKFILRKARSLKTLTYIVNPLFVCAYIKIKIYILHQTILLSTRSRCGLTSKLGNLSEIQILLINQFCEM